MLSKLGANISLHAYVYLIVLIGMIQNKQEDQFQRSCCDWQADLVLQYGA
jgi:hypothetical protein